MTKRIGLSAIVVTAIAVLGVFIFRSSSMEASAKPDKTVKAVRAVIDAQQAAWNKGDIEGFMDGYERAETTVFISGDSLTRGWQTVLERYRKGYATREKMGTLTFGEIEIKPLSEHYAVANGSWHLQRANDQPHGRFTLIFRRTSQGWRVVHDHTSSAD